MHFYRNVHLLGGFKGAEQGGYETAATQADPDANPTVVDGDLAGNDGSGVLSDNSYRFVYFHGAMSSGAKVDGFTFRNGHAADGAGAGGAIRFEVFSGTSSKLLVSRCKFEANHAVGNGNGSPYGGAIASDGQELSVRDCVFTLNGAEPPDPSGNSADGGAIYTNIAIDITNSVFDRNYSLGQKGAGGAVFVYQSLARVANCAFVGNTATIPGGSTHSGFGGAVALQNASSSSRVVNCLFVANAATDYGGAVYADNATIMHQCTLTLNDAEVGGGLYVGGGQSELHNSILWHNTSDAASVLDDQLVLDGSATASISYCDVEGISAGTGNFSEDPAFADVDGADNVAGTADDNCRLLAASPCISAGDGSIRPSDANDVDDDFTFSEPHPLDLDRGDRVRCVMEMGAFERPSESCVGDLDEGGDVDASDLGILLGQWGGHGISDLDCDGDVDAGDLGVLLGAWGDCSNAMSAEALLGVASESIEPALSPASLAESLGFGSVDEFSLWLSELEWDEMVEALAPLVGN
ncbi:MAG: hypothetical protein U0572_06775 [Phycisphaerales bacterium]